MRLNVCVCVISACHIWILRHFAKACVHWVLIEMNGILSSLVFLVNSPENLLNDGPMAVLFFILLAQRQIYDRSTQRWPTFIDILEENVCNWGWHYDAYIFIVISLYRCPEMGETKRDSGYVYGICHWSICMRLITDKAYFLCDTASLDFCMKKLLFVPWMADFYV